MKPGDFLLGVFEFFAILLPGSLATWLAVQYIPDSVLKEALTLSAGSPLESGFGRAWHRIPGLVVHARSFCVHGRRETRWVV